MDERDERRTTGRLGRRRQSAWLMGVLLAVAPARAMAGPEQPAAGRQAAPESARPASQQAAGHDDIDAAVARALLARATELFDQGDHESAKMLLGESLERSPRGPHAAASVTLLRQCNDALGIADRDDGVPPAAMGIDAPLDPYGGGSETLDPYGGASEALDPYGSGSETLDPYGGGSEALDPYADGAQPEGDDAAGASGLAGTGAGSGADGADALAPASEPSEYDLVRGQRTLMLYGGLYGVTAGMAVTGVDSELALAGALAGAGVGLGGTYLLTRNRDITTAQASTVAWSGVWTGTAFGLLTDLVTGIDSTGGGELFAGVALGGLAGSGAGWLLAHELDPSADDVALVNSLGLYGTVGSTLIAIGLDPAQSEAYSLNALVGAVLGLGAGVYAAPRVEVSRRRMLWVDLGAATGALVPWLVLYPLVADQEDGGGLQAAGWLSTLGLFGGAYMAWRWTDGMDEEPLRIGRKQIATVPALIQRTEDGLWHLGAPAVRPAAMPALSPVPGRGLAVDLLGGHF